MEYFEPVFPMCGINRVIRLDSADDVRAIKKMYGAGRCDIDDGLLDKLYPCYFVDSKTTEQNINSLSLDCKSSAVGYIEAWMVVGCKSKAEFKDYNNLLKAVKGS